MKSQQLDGGWGWAVVFASFVSHTLVGALYFAYGIFTESWVEEFNDSPGMTSLIGSTVSVFTSCAAPVASYLLNQWGCRATHIIGAFLVTLGIFLCSFATSLLQLALFFGVMGGSGLGLCYVPSIICLSQYFKKRRGIAIGIASSGIGVGSFVFPVFLEALQENYTWRGTMLILSAIMAHMFACGAAMFPLATDDATPKSSLRRKSIVFLSNLGRHPWLRRKSSLGISLRSPKEESIDLKERKSTVVSAKEDNKIHVNSRDDETIVCIDQKKISTEELERKPSFMTQSKEIFCNNLFYLMVINNVTMFVGMMLVFGLTPIRSTSQLGFTSEDGALMVSIMGLTTLIGRFSWGALTSSCKRLSPVLLFIFLRSIAAVATLLSPLATTYATQMIYSTIVGFAFGLWSLYPIVLANLFGDKSLNVVFGYLEVFDGIGSLLGPTLGGIIYDVTGSFDFSFIFGGATLALGTLVLSFGYILCKRRKCLCLNWHNSEGELRSVEYTSPHPNHS